VQADYLLPRAGIGEVLNRIVREPLADEDGVAGDGADATLAAEVRIAEGNAVEQSIAAVARDPSPFSCPDCGGVLWNVRDDGMQRYRCRIGHAYSAQSLVAGHDDAVRRAFDVALRSLDERAAVAESLAHSARERGWTESAARFDRRAAESREHARVLEQWLRDRTVTSVGWHDVERVP
jgi:two-component system chemotaxis response regulator CheB